MLFFKAVKKIIVVLMQLKEVFFRLLKEHQQIFSAVKKHYKYYEKIEQAASYSRLGDFQCREPESKV